LYYAIPRHTKVCSILAQDNEKYDFIIMAEFLEHVRNPRLFLKFALKHLKKGGILYDSLGSIHKHGVGSDHLKEAKELMDNSDYQRFHESNLIPLNDYLNTKEYNYFYIKNDKTTNSISNHPDA